MRIDDKKHNSFLEVTVKDGMFNMGAAVRLSALLEMYAIAAVFLLIKIFLFRKLWNKWRTRKWLRLSK